MALVLPDVNAPHIFDLSHRALQKDEFAFVDEQHDEEIEANCYSTSFGSELLPGMYSTSIGVVSKPNSMKFHLVSNLSAGPHSLNSWISKVDSSIQLDNLQDFGIILCNVNKVNKHAPAWLFKSYVSGAYCCWPLHPLWKIKQTITIDGQGHVDHCMQFSTHTVLPTSGAHHGLSNVDCNSCKNNS